MKKQNDTNELNEIMEGYHNLSATEINALIGDTIEIQEDSQLILSATCGICMYAGATSCKY